MYPRQTNICVKFVVGSVVGRDVILQRITSLVHPGRSVQSLWQCLVLDGMLVDEVEVDGTGFQMARQLDATQRRQRIMCKG